MTDLETFPHPVYRDTVLAPLFEGVKAHYAAGMDAINRAHLVMLVDTEILSVEAGRALACALDEIARELDLGALTYTGEFEDWFFLVEAELRGRLGDLGGALHTARSRNDMDHTLFKLALRPRVARLEEQVFELAQAMLTKARAERDTLIVAYTHGQPAQPSTFGHYLAAALEVLLRDAARLAEAADGLEHSPMGAAAITTSGFPVDRGRVADLLGFDGVLVNSYGCIASVDYVTGLYSAMKLPFVHLGRLVQDFAFWSSFEVGQLHLPGGLVQISSIMPQKRNPVPVEHMRHLAAVTAGRCDVMVDTMRNTPFTDMNDSEGEVQQAGYAAFESGGRMLELLAAVVHAARIDGAKVRRNADAACVTITELADTLVRDEGLTFRLAHHVAAVTARDVIARGVPLAQGYEAFCAAFADQAGRQSTLDEAGFAEAVSPEAFVARRDRIGGPAPAALDAAFDGYAETLATLRTRHDARRARHETAEQSLHKAFSDLKGA